MLRIKNILIISLLGFFLSACSSDRAGSNESNRSNGVLGVVDVDSDGDGITDIDEETIYGTNPDSTDTDGDGLSDGEEINIYDSNATNKDSDGDGLLDGDEVNTYGTNLKNSDSDGDCLLDSFEILNYETNATNLDTDGDGLADGIEIYSYGLDFNTSCLSEPETLIKGVNHNPAIDNLSSEDTAVINALDSSNHKDTDNDGLADRYEDYLGTNPLVADTDDDGLKDGEEINTYESNATNPDTDGDGLKDGDEVNTYDTNLTNPDTDGDGLKDGEEINTYESNATNPDTDGDGLLDGVEINTYGSNATNPDTDGDGLSDGVEVNTYETNLTNSDTDGDGLKDKEEIFNTKEPTNPKRKDSDNDGVEDGVEVLRDDLNATNPDTDGDCLLDKYEIEFYHTESNNSDTDGDGVPDGIEVYSYTSGEINNTCLSTPEVLSILPNSSPAKDSVVESAKINALDSSNDSDGDGQANITDNSCAEGNPLDNTKRCPYIIDNIGAQALQENNYAYVPGGFDVDGDGINEKGFWVSSYQAREKNEDVLIGNVLAMMSNGYNQYIIDNFTLINGTNQVTGYTNDILDTRDLETPKLVFKKSVFTDAIRLSRVSAYQMMASLKDYRIIDAEANTVDIPFQIMSLKQYVQVRMLLDADKANGGDGTRLRNSLLGNDINIPLVVYSKDIYEFGELYREYTSTLVQLKENGNAIFTLNDIEDWWKDDSTLIVRNIDSDGNQDGSSSVLDVGFQRGINKDNYAVIVMGGNILSLKQGTAGLEEDSSGTTNGISFRSASGYID